MVPLKLGDVWEPRIYMTIGRITLPTILDLGFRVLSIPQSLSDHLDLPLLEKFNVGLLLDDSW
jgi:hypothetical protein